MEMNKIISASSIDSKENSILVANENTSSSPDISKHSILSIDAKEWYPNSNYSKNDITENSNPNSSSPHDDIIETNSEGNTVKKYKKKFNTVDTAIGFLKYVIQRLTLNPEEFDDSIGDLLQILTPFMQDRNTVFRLTCIIFQQAVNNPNFQYSAVRIFSALDEKCPLMYECLHTLCLTTLRKFETFQNILPLVAEIFLKLKYQSFGQCLLKALKNLKPNAENIKMISQTLKIAGGKLEKIDKQLVTELVNQLYKLRRSYPENISLLIESVIKLRDTQWGETNETLVE